MRKIDLEQLILEEQQRQEESPLRVLVALQIWLSTVEKELIPASELYAVCGDICLEDNEAWKLCNTVMRESKNRVEYLPLFYYTEVLKSVVVQLLRENSL